MNPYECETCHLPAVGGFDLCPHCGGYYQYTAEYVRSVMEAATAVILDDPACIVWYGPVELRRSMRPTDPYDINNGYCEEWAELVAARIDEATVEDPYTATGDESYELWGHSFIKYRDKFYDAECLEGVERWQDLPVFSTNVGKTREQAIQLRKLHGEKKERSEAKA
jgi:hypothetical protein